MEEVMVVNPRKKRKRKRKVEDGKDERDSYEDQKMVQNNYLGAEVKLEQHNVKQDRKNRSAFMYTHFDASLFCIKGLQYFAELYFMDIHNITDKSLFIQILTHNNSCKV